MRILVGKDYSEMSKKASQIIGHQITLKPNSVLGLATGITPVGMYQELIRMYESGVIDFSKVVTFNLDEYCDLPQNNSQSYYTFMQENLFSKVNLVPEATHLPKGMVNDIEAECRDYDQRIQDVGGIDLQVLGIGRNAHIGFNEPNQHFEIGTHVVELDKSTLEANARFFNRIEEVPTRAITMGIGTIFKSKKIMLLASGKEKAEAIFMTVKGKVHLDVPASILKLHGNVTLILDEEAASLLDEKDYERF